MIAALVLAMVLLQACMAGVRMAAPLFLLTHGSSDASVGVLLALISGAQLAIALPAGRYCDRAGLRRPMAIAIAASAVSTTIAAAWPSFPFLCLATFCCGGSVGLASIALQRRVGLASRDGQQLQRAFAWLSLGPALANTLGPIVAGACIDHVGWREAFLALAALALSSWFCVRLVPPAPSGSARPSHHAPAHHAPPRSTWRLLEDAPLRRLLIVNWVLQSCWDVHTLLVPLIAHERGFTASQASAMLAAFAAAATASRAALPFVAHRMKEWGVFSVATLVTALALGCFPFSPSFLVMVALSALLGFVLGGVQPVAMSALHRIAPPGRHGEALGLRLVLLNASSTALPLVFGGLGGSVGVSAVFWLMGAVSAMGTRGAWSMRDARR